MRNLFLLLKKDFNQELGISTFLHEKNTLQKRSFWLRIIVVLLLFSIIILVSDLLGKSMATKGFASLIPVTGYFIGSILSLSITILKINEALSGSEDAEFLMSLPVSSFTQVFCLFFKLYLWNTLFCMLTNIPLILSYAQVNTLSAGFSIYWIIGLFMTCLPTTGVAALLGIFFAVVLSGIKNRNLIHSMITLLFFSTLFLLLIRLGNNIIGILGNNTISDSAVLSQQILDQLTKNYKLARFYQAAIVGDQPMWLFIFIVLSAIWHLFFVFFLTISYQELILALRAPKTYHVYEWKIMALQPVKKALYKREVEQWLRSRSYLLSSVLGVLLALLLSFVLVITSPSQIFDVLPVSSKMSSISHAVPFFLCALVGASCTTYCSLSMDGKRHWIFESIPLDEQLLFKVKIHLNLLLTIPPTVICSGLLCVAFRPGVIWGALYFLIPVCYAILNAVYGMFVGYRFADYSSESENQILRQSTSFFIGLVPGVLLPLIIGIVIVI